MDKQERLKLLEEECKAWSIRVHKEKVENGVETAAYQYYCDMYSRKCREKEKAGEM